MFLAGLNAPGRPVGNLLFLGPTGSGKTRVVEALRNLYLETRAPASRSIAPSFSTPRNRKADRLASGLSWASRDSSLLTQEALNQWHTDKLKLSILLFDEDRKSFKTLCGTLLRHPRQGYAHTRR